MALASQKGSHTEHRIQQPIPNKQAWRCLQTDTSWPNTPPGQAARWVVAGFHKQDACTPRRRRACARLRQTQRQPSFAAAGHTHSHHRGSVNNIDPLSAQARSHIASLAGTSTLAASTVGRQVSRSTTIQTLAAWQTAHLAATMDKRHEIHLTAQHTCLWSLHRDTPKHMTTAWHPWCSSQSAWESRSDSYDELGTHTQQRLSKVLGKIATSPRCGQ